MWSESQEDALEKLPYVCKTKNPQYGENQGCPTYMRMYIHVCIRLQLMTIHILRRCMAGSHLECTTCCRCTGARLKT